MVFHTSSFAWNARAAAMPSARRDALCMWIFTSRKPASSRALRSVGAIGIVEEILVVVDVGGSVIDGLPHIFLRVERAGSGNAVGQEGRIVHVDLHIPETGVIQSLAQRRGHLPPNLRRLFNLI